MEYKRLGQTNLEVSRVGFGCWALGGHGWGKVDDEESIQAVRKALDLGINFFDTADAYGFGHSEQVLCAALGEARKKVIIATKFGVRWDERGNISRDCSPSRVVEALEGSLRRLQMDCIPLYYIHWPDARVPLEATLEALKRCQEAGKIWYIGCSNFAADMLPRARALAGVDCFQGPYNLVDRDVENEILPCCEQLGIGVVAYNPLAQGLLTGKFGREAHFGSDDIRSRSKYFEPKDFESNLKVVDRLRVLAARYGRTPSQFAIRWILEHAAITAAIPGVKKCKQIEENAGAVGWKLSNEDREFLSAGTRTASNVQETRTGI